MFLKFPNLYLLPHYERKDSKKGNRHVLKLWL